jgi:hypothetical protein
VVVRIERGIKLVVGHIIDVDVRDGGATSAWGLQHSDHRPDQMPNVRKQKNCIRKQKKKVQG